MIRKISVLAIAACFVITAAVFGQTTASWSSNTAQNTYVQIGTSGFATIEVSVQAFGTITGGQLAFEECDDGVCGASSPWYPVAIGRTDTLQIDSTYALATAGAKQAWWARCLAFSSFRVRLSTVIAGGTIYVTENVSSTSSGGPVAVSFSPSAPDPCMNPNIGKSSVALTASGQIVALATGKVIYLCGSYATLGGTTPTLKFQTGTGANCGTGTADLTGAFALTVGQEFFVGHGSTVIQTPASQALCVLLAGTSPTIAGVATYVQQ